MPWRSFIALVSLVGCGASGAVSSSNLGNDEELALALLSTTAAGGLATTLGVITTRVNNEERPSLLVEHRREIEVSLARGQGAWIDDLAAELGLPEGLVPRLGQTLRRHREHLTEVLNQEPVRVDLWRRELGEALCCDPCLLPFASKPLDCAASTIALSDEKTCTSPRTVVARSSPSRRSP